MTSAMKSTTQQETTGLKEPKDYNYEYQNLHAADSPKQYILQYGITLLATLAVFDSGIHCGWVGPTIHRLMSNGTEIPLTAAEVSWLAGSLPLGGVIGPTVGSLLANLCGRKTTILLVSIPSIVTWILIGFASNAIHLCIAQVITGIGVLMAFAVLPMYIGEIASPKIRGALGTFIAVQFYLGFLIGTIVSSYVSMGTNALIGFVIPIILICTFIWAPESPYYYLMKNQPGKAAKSLEILTQAKNVEIQLERLNISIKSKAKTTILQLFKNRKNRHALFILFGVTTIQEWSGLAAILVYSQLIFAEAQTPIDANFGGIILSAMGILFLFVTFVFVDLWGRRPLLIMSAMMTSIPQIMIAVYFHLKAQNYENISSYGWVPIIALVIFKLTFAVGIGPLPSVLASEIFETNFKAPATGLLCTYGAFNGFVINKVFKAISDAFGIYTTFYVFAVCCLLGTVFIYFFVPETKKKTLEEIQDSF